MAGATLLMYTFFQRCRPSLFCRRAFAPRMAPKKHVYTPWVDVTGRRIEAKRDEAASILNASVAASSGAVPKGSAPWRRDDLNENIHLDPPTEAAALRTANPRALAFDPARWVVYVEGRRVLVPSNVFRFFLI